MREIELLRHWDAGEEPLTDEARDRARARLLAAMRGTERAGTAWPDATTEPTPAPRRRWMLRAALGGVLTAAVAAVTPVVADLVGDRSGLVTSPPAAPSPQEEAGPAEVLRAAAAYEREHAEEIAPRDDQFVYAKRTVQERIQETGETRTHTDEFWMSVDGSRPSRTEGSGQGSWNRTSARDGRNTKWPPRTWRELEELPTDPDGLLRSLRDRLSTRPDTGHPSTVGEWPQAGAALVELLRDAPVLPPKLRAAVYEALARVPGITAAASQEHVGGVVIFLEGPQGESTQGGTVFVFDAESHAYLGMRTEDTKDTADGRKAYLRSGPVEYAVVDRAGQRP
ncbi:CU044_5270 family protein [Streptomyces radiopugnans]|nr:CU044_5270 family protein [Streptomyces radiopugnans]